MAGKQKRKNVSRKKTSIGKSPSSRKRYINWQFHRDGRRCKWTRVIGGRLKSNNLHKKSSMQSPEEERIFGKYPPRRSTSLHPKKYSQDNTKRKKIPKSSFKYVSFVSMKSRFGNSKVKNINGEKRKRVSRNFQGGRGQAAVRGVTAREETRFKRISTPTCTEFCFPGKGISKSRRRRRRRRQWKRKLKKKLQPKIELATLNTVSLLGIDNKIEILNAVNQKNPNIKIVSLQEVRDKRSGCLDVPNLQNEKDQFRYYYSGTKEGDKEGQGGVAIAILDPKIKVIEVNNISNRMMYLDITFTEQTINIGEEKNKEESRITRIISIYAPTNCSYSIKERKLFYNKLQLITDDCKKKKINYLLFGDFNARLDTGNNLYPSNIGKFGYEQEFNSNGNLLLNFMIKNNIAAMNTFFRKKKNRNYYTWQRKSNIGFTRATLDYILLPKKDKFKVSNCYATSHLPTTKFLDHSLVIIKLNNKIKLYFVKKIKRKKIIAFKINDQVISIEHSKKINISTLVHDVDLKDGRGHIYSSYRLEASKALVEALDNIENVDIAKRLDCINFRAMAFLHFNGANYKPPSRAQNFFSKHWREDQEDYFRAKDIYKALRETIFKLKKIDSLFPSNDKNKNKMKRLTKRCNKWGKCIKTHNEILKAEELAKDRSKKDILTYFEDLKDIHKSNETKAKSIYQIRNKKGQVIEDPLQIVELIKEHALELLNKESIADPDIELLGEVLMVNNDLCKTFTQLEIAEMLRNLPMNKSGGLGAEDETGQLVGDIPIEVIKYAADTEFVEQLRLCFDDIILNCNVPKSFLKSVCIYLYKKGDATILDNYRGLCLNNNLYKLFIKLIVDRLVTHCEERGILSEDQQGFRFGRSCNDANSIFTTIKNLCMKYGKNLFVGYIDIKKAYDSVDRTLLWRILRHIGVPEQLIMVIKKLYDENEICIRLGDDLSSYFRTTVGLKQGCPLSPLLFIIYFEFAFRLIHEIADENDGIDLISALPNGDILSHPAGSDQQFGIIRKPSPYDTGDSRIRLRKLFKILKLLFADDAGIFNYTSNGLKRVLQICNEIFIKFNLELAISKTEVMIFINDETKIRKLEYYSNDKEKRKYFKYYEKDDSSGIYKLLDFRLITVESMFTPTGIPTCTYLKKLNIVESFKYLGNLYVPERDSFEKQVNKAKSSADSKFVSYCNSKGLYDKNKYYDKIDKITHFLSIIVPTLLYSIEIWSITSKMIDELNSWLYGKILFIFNLRRRHHVSFANLIATLKKNKIKVYPFHILIAARRLKYHGNICRKEDHSFTKLIHFGTLRLEDNECKVKNSFNHRSKILVRDSLQSDLEILNLTDYQQHHTNPLLWNKLIDEGCEIALDNYFKIESEKSLARAKQLKIPEQHKKKSEEVIEKNVNDVFKSQNMRSENEKVVTTSFKSRQKFSKESGLKDTFNIISKINSRWKKDKYKNHYTNHEKGMEDEREKDVTRRILEQNKYFNKSNQWDRKLKRSLFGRMDNLKISDLNENNSVTFRNLSLAKNNCLDDPLSEAFVKVFREFLHRPYQLEVQRQEILAIKEANKEQELIWKQNTANYIEERRKMHPHEYCSLIVKKTGLLCTKKPLVGDTLCKTHRTTWNKEMEIPRCKEYSCSTKLTKVILLKNGEYCSKHSKNTKASKNLLIDKIQITLTISLNDENSPPTEQVRYCPAIKLDGSICGRKTVEGNQYCKQYHAKLEK